MLRQRNFVPRQWLFRYRVHIGSFPRPLVVTPAGGEAGKEIEFTFLGDPRPFKKTITLPNNGEKS